MEFKIFGKGFTDHCVNNAAHLGVAQLCFGLTLEFRVRHFH